MHAPSQNDRNEKNIQQFPEAKALYPSISIEKSKCEKGERDKGKCMKKEACLSRNCNGALEVGMLRDIDACRFLVWIWILW